MIAMDETRMRGPLPRKIYLYFMHGNTLDYRKEAFLYANLLTYSDDQAMFLNYREQIVTFTWEQLIKSGNPKIFLHCFLIPWKIFR